MAYSNDQNEPKVPISNVEKRSSADLLPRFYRTPGNKKFLQATVDQLIQPGTVKKLNGYVGRQTAKAVVSSDTFLEAADQTRQNYQLEPAAVIQDYLGNTTFFKDYIDHINHVSVFDGVVDNHSRLNREEFYSWNPNICWDKFVNYQQYYWLPFGPRSIEVLGNELEIISTYSVTGVDETDNVAYLFNPEGPLEGLIRNPKIRLFRGQTYIFDVDATGHPFSIKTQRTAGDLYRYTKGVDAFAVEKGKITFTVPVDAPDVLFYVSENAVDTGGVFHVLDITENTAINLTTDFLGKKEYIIPNGTAEGLRISNGMKLSFGGQVTPEEYAEDFWYVEGVGAAIRLVRDKDLEVRTSFNEESSILFDDNPFDQLPFGDASTLPSSKDYITINRSSPDKNSWSRYNRWFHQDVIIASATANGVQSDLDQTQRAIRPIIEFNSGIKLHNHGISSKQNIDVIDNFTKDVFSTIEGSLGYNVDGIDLADGMRVIFTKDTDILVRNKVYRVNFINVVVPSRQISFNGTTSVDVTNNTFTFASEHGLSSNNRVTYLNNGFDTLPGLTNRQVYYVKVIDSFTIELHTNNALTKQVDIFSVVDAVYKFEVFSGSRRQITLTEEPDATAVLYESVTVNYGTQEILTASISGNQGQTYWFTGTTWKLSQIKTKINQAPLFDLFDNNQNSFVDNSIYDGSTFEGNKIFSYKVGTGTVDSELGFPLTYQNINNIGDIVFEFNLLTDKFAYKQLTNVLYKDTATGYLKISKDIDRATYENGWTTSLIADSQPVVRVFKDHSYNGTTVPFPIDVFDNKNDLTDLEVRVYINGIRLAKDQYTVVDSVVRKQVVLTTPVTTADVVTLRCFAKQAKNSNGYYELPISLQNNPLNHNVEQFTLGQVIDHVGSIVDNITTFTGTYPGYGNLRDIGNLSPYGVRFVQHSGPMNLSLYHLGSKSANIVKAIDIARNDYGKFKRAFIVAATESGIDTDPRRHVDFVLQMINKDRPKTSPYYLSDMFGYTASNRIEYTVLDSRIKTYPLTSKFVLSTLSNKSVNIYLNGEQLVHGRDYIFGDDVFFELLIDISQDDLIEAYEYETTDGCFCPATPTKLGLYPKFEPKIYVDDTYAEPTRVIQGHDGSITIAFDDYRDQLILELETRIFNNIKCEYNQDIFNIYDYIPGYSRSTLYSFKEFNRMLSKYFFQWTSNIQEDYTKHIGYDQTDSFTYNYRGNFTPDNQDVPAAWRGIYIWLLDTIRPHSHPWECLGFSIEPAWWQDVYGPAPYTSDNLILWDDIKEGIIREPGVPVRRDVKFAKSSLAYGLPVDDQGVLLSPKDSGMVSGTIRSGDGGYFEFGDQATVESAWRRSSYYSFALIETCLLMQPNSVLGRCLDRSRIVKNLNNQLVYSETGLRLRLEDIVIPSTSNRNGDARVYTCGLINYLVDYLSGDNVLRLDEYQSDLTSLTNKITTRLGAFTSQPKYKILLDSKTPSSTGGVFVPEENYYVDLNISSATAKVVYSGVIITKFADGFEVKGYDFDNPYFTYYPSRQDDRIINVGGISESYITWNSNQIYAAGKIVKNNNQYYRVKTNHTSGETFDSQYYARLSELPVVGGRDAMLRKTWDYDEPQTIAYGTKITTIQAMVDFLQGYGAYLEQQGFVFDDFNNELAVITNWETSVKEFLFWSTQNWAAGAVISLSPAANRLIFKSNTAAVDDLTDPFYGYSIFRVDGQKLDPEFITTYRKDGEFTLQPQDTNHGIFGATLFLVQKEHIVVLDNTTLFNDIVYDAEAGYRQERVKVLGYVTSNWNGSFEIPGFIYDRAIVNAWTPWTDFALGDIVKHKEFYYSAKSFLIGTETFNDDSWVLLTEKPKSELLPNWDYKAETFADFYDLDTDNLDSGQQKIAQHLIGYQKRQYLENIIQNDVSQYKFYQGMIIEKGTQNVLNKLFDVLSADGMESLTFDEEWAFRVGEYGAVDTFDEVEFKLNEKEFKTNPQPIELVNSIDPLLTDFVYRQRPVDVYVKPYNYTNDIWPVKTTGTYLRTPGYVRSADVKLSIDNLQDLITVDISSFKEGDYVWCAFENRDWNVYRFSETPFKISNITYSNKVITVVCDKVLTLNVGDVVGIENSISVKGFHIVASVSLNTFTVSKELQGWQTWTDQDTVLSYQFNLHRVENIDNANSIIPRYIKPRELIWSNNNGQNKWTVYQHAPVYSRGTILNLDVKTNLNFGLATAITDDGNLAVVTDNDGVTIYEKSSSDNVWLSRQRILPVVGSVTMAPGEFGSLVKFSKDGRWLAISAPLADSGTSYEQGRVFLYVQGDGGQYNLLDIIASPTPTAGEKFGINLAFGRKPNPTVLYSALTGTYTENGSGAVWSVTRIGSSYVLLVSDRGLRYKAGETIIIPGSQLGGSNIDNDLTITINTVDSVTGSIENFTYTGTGLGDVYILAITAEGYNSNQGRVYTYKFESISGWNEFVALTTSTISGDYFGYDLAIDSNLTIVVSAPAADTESGKVFVYSYTDTGYALSKTLIGNIVDDAERFGESVSITTDGEYIAVGSTLMNVNNKKDVGQILIYKKSDSTYTAGTPYQVIDSPRNEVNERYGTDLEFMNDKTLVVFSKNGNIENITVFDELSTTFDNGNLQLIDVAVDVGRIDIFDMYNTKFVYGESLDNISVINSGYGEEIAVGNNTVLVSAIKETSQGFTNSGNVYSYIKPAEKFSWMPIHTQVDSVDIGKIKKVYLYNTVTNELVKYLDVIDPLQGKIPGVADQEIRYKTFYDPAIYSVGTSAVNVDDGMNWTTVQVGQLWWDLTRAKFLDTQSGDVIYRTSSWNVLYETASIDVYEWVETSLLPAAWIKQSSTDAGIARGISGTPKYGDEVYSVKKRYDSVSKTFKETYFYWVKNKKDTPNVSGRTLSGYDVAQLIADPAGYGYSYITFTGTNSFALVNCEKYLQSNNVALSVQYWLSDYKTSNYHSQWKLLSTNRNTIIPTAIEEKWFDSLIGKDSNDRVIPDTSLPLKNRYGIEFKPRQSMFMNRVEALKVFVESVNASIKNELIADDYDLAALDTYEPLPSEVSGLWDIAIDTDLELRFIPTTLLQTALLKPIITNGRITGVTIVSPGYGYGTLREYPKTNTLDPDRWYGPDVKIVGTGANAKIKSIIDAQGRVVSYEIENSGEGYTASTTAVVRDISVLVSSDSESLDLWSIYSWSVRTEQWTRTKSQSYDVRKYWQYLDWYADGYNQFIKIDYLVENTYELTTTYMDVGSIAKVRNVGRGGWLLLIKVADTQTIDYTQNFTVIGRQNGTIKFLESLYQFKSSTLGFDGPLFDADIFDNSPTTELRIILETVRDKLLIDEYRTDYLKVFFACVRYALSEQTFIDWAFKTSFVKSQHNVGELKQKVTYNSDNLEFFEEYIKEVKPYRTKVREYVSNYTSLDYSQSSVSDFDLLPVIDDNRRVAPLLVQVNDSAEIVTDFSEILTYPWRHWHDTVGFEITSIEIVDGGSGYITKPLVKIYEEYQGVVYKLPDSVAAEARAYISNGRVNRIELVSGGTRWVRAPKIEIIGGLATTGTAATAVAIIGQGVVRSNYVKIKFDRTSKVYEITELTEVETFSGTGARTQYLLKWAPDIKVGESYVTIDNAEVLRDDYTLKVVESVSKGYTSYSGQITFKNAPPANSATPVNIRVEYKKDFVHLNAPDRINFYYNPQTGQLGKDLAQLMTGVDYGGVEITGLGFGINAGWDALPWFSEPWDTIDPEFEDYIVTVSSITYSYRMPYVPAENQQINIYISRYNGTSYEPSIRIDDPNYATILQTNDDALMLSFTGDGEIDIINLPVAVALSVNDRLVFRKDTSDGSYGARPDEYDTKLSGGNLAYTSATGLAADDIILDGDDLVSANTSHAPEEVVPGQVMDTVAIKVYHRPSGGCPNIMFNHHRGNAVDTDFKIGQYFPNDRSVIVKVDNLIKTLSVDYTIDYQSNSVVFNTAPSQGVSIDILSISFNSANILDLDYFISDGVTTEYLTKANWLPTIASTVLVNGAIVAYELFSTDDQYTDFVGQTWRSRAGIRFAVAPPAGALINYIIDTSVADQTSSVVKLENLTYTGVDTYPLGNIIGIDSPLDQNVLVKTNQTILKPASANYFTIENSVLEYSLRDYKYLGVTINPSDVKVYKDNTLLAYGTEYTLDFDYTGTVYGIDPDSLTITGGSGYTVGDILDADGGTVSPTGTSAKFEVIFVNGTGRIQLLEIVDSGSYDAPPANPFNLSGGSGVGAALTANFEIISDQPNITVKLKPDAYTDGSALTVVIESNADYIINSNNSITFTNSYPLNTPFEIISFYNHNILKVERTVDELIPAASLVNGTTEYYELVSKLGGNFKLRNTAVSGDFVWVIKNGELLIHGVDYYLQDDFITVKLAESLFSSDVVQVMAFTNVVVHESFAYMQFKDILNRVHYKRLNKSKSTLLARDLFQFDKEIYVDDASTLDNPMPSRNVPGIIEINGERIEYFVKIGNVLSQLHRGTLGTGMPYYHSADSLVQGLGASETIPYKDESIVVTHTITLGDTGKVSLPYIPSINDMEVFIAGYRLKKHQYSVYSNVDYPDSTEGDMLFSAEFEINGTAELQLNVIDLTAKGLFVPGVKITVVKRQGRLWNDIGERLAKSNNPIANFLKETGTNWVETYLDKYEDRVLGGDGNPLSTGDGEPLEY